MYNNGLRAYAREGCLMLPISVDRKQAVIEVGCN